MVIWSQVFLSNKNKLQTELSDASLIGTSIFGQSKAGSNGIKGVHNTPQNSRARASASVQCHTQDTPIFGGNVLFLQEDTVSVFLILVTEQNRVLDNHKY